MKGDFVKEFYVYMYLDPRKPGDYNYGDLHFDYEPFYVGKGSGDRYKGKHMCNTLLNGKITHIGKDNLIINIDIMPSEEAAHLNEIIRIAMIGRYDLGTGPLCNLTNGGDGFVGAKHTEDSKKKMSMSRKGIQNFLGKKHTKESIEKIRKTSLGRNPSYETKRKLSLAAMGNKNALGHKRSQETKRKMSLAKIGKKCSDETKKKMSFARLGKRTSDETRKKISLAVKKWHNEKKISKREDC